MRRIVVLVALTTVVTALTPETLEKNENADIDVVQDENSDSYPFVWGSSTIEQMLDHFNESNTRTWEQRYYFNHLYVKNDTNVNILYISGENTNQFKSVIGKSYVHYARELNADVYSLEHRFYGRSRPTEDTSVENLLAYFNSRQAIEDIANFIRHINEQKGDTEQKWITVGGSYAGCVSAWSRLKHPELIVGAISSSAALQVTLDNYGFIQHTDEVFKKQGGLCYDQISKGLDAADKLFQSEEGRATLTEIFQIRPPLSSYDVISRLDLDTFYNFLINPFKLSAQYSNTPPAELCKTFTANGPDYDPLKAFKLLIKNPININYTETLRQWSHTSFLAPGTSTRLWIFQTCNELGYFLTTNRGSNSFRQAQSTKNIEATLDQYGGRDYYAGTNVIFTHGTKDPWSTLTKNSDPLHWSVVIVEIEDGSHTQDLADSCFVPGNKCTDSMKYAQSLTLDNMRRWIDPLFPVPDRVDITDNVGRRPQLIDPYVAPALTVNVNYPDAVKLRAKRSSDSFSPSKRIDFKHWNKFTGKGRKVLLPPPVEAISTGESNNAGQDWIVQTFDHFNMNEVRTYRQKFYFNYKFGSDDGPNFLMIGGEGPEDGSWTLAESSTWMQSAQAVGANVFLLEHRYYGESKLETNDLQFLTSAQMLYDVATFIRTQQSHYKRTGPWITFGGSYPGALAAWSREWFPELIVGAVASSAPVIAKNDFYEYLEVVEDVIQRQSSKCYARTREAFEKLDELTQNPEGRVIIQEKFQLTPAWTEETVDALDRYELFSALYGMYQGTVQYNAVDWSDVANLCKIIEDDQYEDALDALSALRKVNYGEDDLSSSFDEDVEKYSKMLDHIDGHDEEYSDDQLAGLLWMWQTCNEFGYYQSTDYGQGIFGTPVPLNFFIIACERVFGVGMEHVEKGVSRTNYQYGGRSRFNTTNAVFVNGDADPWSTLGITEQSNLDESVVPIVIKGTSHCADMYGQSPADPPELVQARQRVMENIQRWIAGSSLTTAAAESSSTQSTRGTSPTVSPTTSSALSHSVLPTLIAIVFISVL